MAAGVLQYVIINMLLLLLLLLQSSLLTRDSIWKPTACNLLGVQTLVSCFITRHASLVTRHTSHVTRHTSHVTRHTSHVTHRYFLHAAIGYSSGLALAMLIARCERMPHACCCCRKSKMYSVGICASGFIWFVSRCLYIIALIVVHACLLRKQSLFARSAHFF